MAVYSQTGEHDLMQNIPEILCFSKNDEEAKLNDCAFVLRNKEQMPSLFGYKGKIYASNLFKLHDTVGFPLSASLYECDKRDWYPCLAQFVCDALMSGWPKARAERIVAEAIADSGCMTAAAINYLHE